MQINDLLNFIKFEHSIFALPFIYAGMFIAIKIENFNFDILKFFVITIAAVSARSTAMALNRIIDKDIDALNPRTANRHLPSGKIKMKNAYLFTAISAIIFLISAYLLNFTCFILAPIPLIMFIIYPYLKRYTYLSHLFLGLTLGIGVGGGFIAITGNFENLIYPFVLAIFVMFWVAGFDIIYAIQDIQFDRMKNLYSIPAKFGAEISLKISLIFHFISILILILFFILAFHLFHSPFLFASGIIIISLLLIYEHKICSSKSDSDIQKAFFNVNGIVSVTFLIFLISGMFI